MANLRSELQEELIRSSISLFESHEQWRAVTAGPASAIAHTEKVLQIQGVELLDRLDVGENSNYVLRYEDMHFGLGAGLEPMGVPNLQLLTTCQICAALVSAGSSGIRARCLLAAALQHLPSPHPSALVEGDTHALLFSMTSWRFLRAHRSQLMTEYCEELYQ